MKKYTADFETATWLKNETFVWAWALCDIESEEIITGNNIESFINKCKEIKNGIIYFHNLKFDGEFIIYFLLKHKFKHIKDKKDKSNNTFTTLISNMGQFYSIEVYFNVSSGKTRSKITFIDSLKIIPFSVEAMAKSFGLPINKLEIDYNKERSKNHKITKDEEEYIKNDVLIVAKSLKILFKENLTKMTIGSNALSNYKETITYKKFLQYFKELPPIIDEDIRKAYKGGFTYLNPYYKDKDVYNGVVLDVNSLYPSVMRNEKLPFGEPFFYEGKYKNDKVYPLYIQMITCSFEIKKNKIPTIQLKNNRSFIPNEYLTSSNNEIVTLTLTNIDLKLFFENYEVYDLEYIAGWKFKSMKGLFNEYIDKWIKIKNEATINNNKGQRTLAKLMLNSLYGKFATSLETQSKEPFLEDDIVKYKNLEKENKKGVYLPMGCFITAYAREKTIRTSQAITDYSLKKYGKDLYIYSDTDSIHTLLSIEELKQFCEIDPVKLGAWAHEGSFTKGKFIRQKCYIEMIEGKMEITCAGMPPRCYDKVEWKTFKEGLTVDGKLTYSHVKGGVKLIDTTFTIKYDKKLSNSIKSL